MTARKALEEALDAFERDYAHELAERIRKANDDFRDAAGSYLFATEAADVIDPYKEQSWPTTTTPKWTRP
jgi:hypothetical protein